MQKKIKENIHNDIKRLEYDNQPSADEISKACRENKISEAEFRARRKISIETTKDIVTKYHTGKEREYQEYKKDRDILEEAKSRGALKPDEYKSLNESLRHKHRR